MVQATCFVGMHGVGAGFHSNQCRSHTQVAESQDLINWWNQVRLHHDGNKNLHPHRPIRDRIDTPALIKTLMKVIKSLQLNFLIASIIKLLLL